MRPGFTTVPLVVPILLRLNYLSVKFNVVVDDLAAGCHSLTVLIAFNIRL